VTSLTRTCTCSMVNGGWCGPRSSVSTPMTVTRTCLAECMQVGTVGADDVQRGSEELSRHALCRIPLRIP